jgi:AAA domain
MPKALPWIEQRIGLALAESQVAAIRLALISKVLVMTGRPGVGKTTIVKGILRILAAKGTNLLLCAPTGRAAKRMAEATGFEAKTIHRLLEVAPKGGGFKRGDDNPLDCDLLVVDEASMVDVMLMQALMKAVPDKSRWRPQGRANWFAQRTHCTSARPLRDERSLLAAHGIRPDGSLHGLVRDSMRGIGRCLAGDQTTRSSCRARTRLARIPALTNSTEPRLKPLLDNFGVCGCQRVLSREIPMRPGSRLVLGAYSRYLLNQALAEACR